MLRAAPSLRAPIHGLRVLTRSLQAAQPLLLIALVLCFAVSGCRHSESHEREAQKGSPGASATASLPAGMDLFDLKAHPNATIVHPVDPHSLSESQIKFGIAPKRDPSVEYQPGIILMENGDKAIKSAAGDGMTWTFDANAPQVSDFQEGKIVFATGRAVGRVLSLRRQGDSVSVILGPIQLTDVIRNGSFEMHQDIDLNNMISYVAPDYPQPPDESEQSKISFNRKTSPDHVDERMVLSRVSRAGKWTPATMVQTFANGHRASYYKTGRRWSATMVHANRLANGPGIGFGGARLERTSGQSLQMPGTPGVDGIHPLQIPVQPFTPPPTLGQLPIVNLQGGRAIPMAGSDGGIGVEYDYDKDGLKLRASGYMTIQHSGVDFFLHFKDGVIQDCGVRLNGNVGIKLHLNASAAQDFKANFHKKLWLPIDLSIPLGGPVPLSLTFNSSFLVDTAFSAKTSVLNAEGEYSLGAGVEAGYWAKAWRLHFPSQVKTNTDIGNSVEGISVGINSIVMGFDVRTMVGIGAFGFNSGVYMAFRFSGTALKSPNIGFACRQGTIDINLDSGVGYSIPKWVTDAINIFLSPFTSKRVDRAGTFLRGPSNQLFQHVTQNPEGCASQKGGG
jgi:hypothetical protein